MNKRTLGGKKGKDSTSTSPTNAPTTSVPTKTPTIAPTSAPSDAPTSVSPTITTFSPSTSPSASPTISPTNTSLSPATAQPTTGINAPELTTAEASPISKAHSSLIIGSSLTALGFIFLAAFQRRRSKSYISRTKPPRMKEGESRGRQKRLDESPNVCIEVYEEYEDPEPPSSFASSTDLTVFTDMLPVLAKVPLACPCCKGAPVHIRHCPTCADSYFTKTDIPEEIATKTEVKEEIAQ